MSSRTLIADFCHDRYLTDQEYIDVVDKLAALNNLKAPRDKPYREVFQWAEDHWTILGKTLQERMQARDDWIQYANSLGDDATPYEWQFQAMSYAYLKIVRLCGHKIKTSEFIEIGRRAASISNVDFHMVEQYRLLIYEWFQMNWDKLNPIILQLNLPYQFDPEIQRHGIDFLGSTYPNVRRHLFDPE